MLNKQKKATVVNDELLSLCSNKGYLSHHSYPGYGKTIKFNPFLKTWNGHEFVLENNLLFRQTQKDQVEKTALQRKKKTTAENISVIFI